MAAVPVPPPEQGFVPIMHEALLLPSPQRLRRGEGSLSLAGGIALRFDGSLAGITAALDRLLGQLLGEPGVDPSATPVPLRLTLDGGRLGREEYRLRITRDDIVLRAGSAAGAAYGLTTLGQWITVHDSTTDGGRAIPCIEVEDAPDVAQRGVMLDVSRSRVPSMEHLLATIDRLASWKINQLQLYTEHTFAYRGHEDVWRDSSPLTPDQVREIDRYCTARHIELVPNQNSFGHLHRWLALDRYRPLAECPEGIDHPFSGRTEPFSLCPTDPGSLDLLDDLYGQLLPNFGSPNFHIGFDETIDLGRGRSRAAAENLGVPRLYGDFLRQVRKLAAQHGKRVQIWGDIVAQHEEILERAPEDVVVMDWGYEGDHPFDERAETLAKSGHDFFLCPGTSSWLSLAGRLENAKENIRSASLAAARHGATGLLVTDWGDQGHLQPPAVSEPGLALAAALFWNVRTEPPAVDILAAQLDLHSFVESPSSGPSAPLLAMAQLYVLPGASIFNGSPLFYLLTRPDIGLDHKRLVDLDLEGLLRCSESLADIAIEGASLPAREVDWVHRAMTLATAIGIARLEHDATESARQLPSLVRRDLAASLTDLSDSHVELRGESTRPGGLHEATAVLEKARSVFSDDTVRKHG